MTMNILRHILLITAGALLLGCDKTREPAELTPVAYFKLLPAAGNTTTVFRFDADSVTGQGSRENPVLVRWDWESDGIWDWMYSTGSAITHRFFKAGTYRILMEASTISGKRDTMSISLNVPQGYSSPRAGFSMSPDSANLTHEFTFDASLSKDDEDSLNQLEFRWDFNGDQIWDTDFSKNPSIKHRYNNDFRYPVWLEVRDQQLMTSIKINTLVVTRLNDGIVPVVTHECWPCTVEDTVRFNASGSYYKDRPGARLLFSWDLHNDNIWEITLNESPEYRRTIKMEGIRTIRLRVTDEEGLYMDLIDSVELFPVNSPPFTVLTIGNRIGNPATDYYLHLRASTDRDNSYMDLKARWDINNDGIGEAEYDNQYEIHITFPAPGKYAVTAMMSDPNNKFTTDTDTVWVVEGDHETGLMEDRRGTFLPTYYGTVKIGNRWWMQSNLQYMSTSKDAWWSGDFYNNDASMKSKYGVLYPFAALGGHPNACPTGWHIPTVAEWQQLMTDLGQDASIERLLLGGKSEMHVLLAGQKDFDATGPAGKDKFSGLGQFADFWTSDVTRTGQAYTWYIDPVRKQNRAVVVGKNYWFPIRCIKD